MVSLMFRLCFVDLVTFSSSRSLGRWWTVGCRCAGVQPLRPHIPTHPYPILCVEVLSVVAGSSSSFLRRLDSLDALCQVKAIPTHFSLAPCLAVRLG